VYIYDMSGDVERIRTPILSLPIIAYFARIFGTRDFKEWYTEPSVLRLEYGSI